MTPTLARPQYEADPGDPQRVKLAGDWTLASALTVAEQLKTLPETVNRLDATAINRIDSPAATPRAISSRSTNDRYLPCRFRPRRGLTPPAATSIRFAVVRFTPIVSPTSLANWPAWKPSHAC